MPLDNTPPSRPWDKSYPKDLRWDAEIPEITMVDLFDEAVKKYKDRACLSFMGKELSYKEVGGMVDGFAKGLQNQGIGKGSKVGLCLPNTSFYVVAYYGALKAGATVVNFNPLYPENEMEEQIRDSQADMMVTLNLQQFFPKVEHMLGKASLKKIIVCDMADALPGIKSIALKEGNKHPGTLNVLTTLANIFLPQKIAPVRAVSKLRKSVKEQPFAKIKKNKNILSFDKLVKTKGKPQPVDIHPDDIAVLQYTGGTTGVPKAAMLSHGNLSANTQQAALWFTGGKERPKPDISLAVLPFFHVFSMTVLMNLPLLMGGKNVILPKFEVEETLETITKEKPTIFAGVPTVYQKMMACKTLDKYDLSSLEVCISGGAALAGETLQAFKKLTGIELLEGYGLSESSAAAIANPLNGERKPGSIGVPLPGTEVKLVPLEDTPLKDTLSSVKLPGADTPVTVKEGELCLRGPQVMKGYWKRPEENIVDAEGWLHTGDIGRMDDDGYFSIVGRTKDMIIVSGLNVFPRRIEEALLKHEAVAEAAVIGVKDKTQGESVKAIIVLREGKTVTDAALNTFMRQHVAPYEVPRIVERREALPLTLIGKPDKKVLKKEQADAEAAAGKSAPPRKNGGPQV